MADIIKDNNTLVLKLEKKGSVYTASCSADGKTFKTVGSAEFAMRDIKAGMINCEGQAQTRRGGNQGLGAQQPAQSETPFEAAFDYFHIVNKGAK